MTNTQGIVACIVGVLAGLLLSLPLMLLLPRWLDEGIPWPWAPDYTPPTYQEFEAAVGGTNEDPFENLRRWELMKLVMANHVYDRDEAFERLANIKQQTEDHAQLMAQLKDDGVDEPIVGYGR